MEDGRAESAMKSSLHHLLLLGAAQTNFLKLITNFKHIAMKVERIIKRMTKDGWKVSRSLPTSKIIGTNKMRTIMCKSYNDAYKRIYG